MIKSRSNMSGMALLEGMPKMLLIMLIILALAPFYPMPHLIEKIIMLINGRLSHIRDIFDLVFHGGAAAIVITKAVTVLIHKLR